MRHVATSEEAWRAPALWEGRKRCKYSGQIGSGRSELRGVNAMAAPVIQVGGQWDIRQDNGFRVSVNINQEGDQLDAFCTHSGGSVRSREATGFVRGED